MFRHIIYEEGSHDSDCCGCRRSKGGIGGKAALQMLKDWERRKLLDQCGNDCQADYHGQDIYWPEVDRINALIGKATTRDELMPLLEAYVTAVAGPPEITETFETDAIGEHYRRLDDEQKRGKR